MFLAVSIVKGKMIAPDMPSLRMHITIQNGVKEKE